MNSFYWDIGLIFYCFLHSQVYVFEDAIQFAVTILIKFILKFLIS